MTRGGDAAARRMVGPIIGVVFGLVFVLVNSGPLPSPWPIVLRVAGVVVAILLAVKIVGVLRRPGGGAEQEPNRFDRNYRLIVAAEVVGLFGGLAIINGVLGAGEFGIAWIAVVVGVHFFGLGAIWRSVPLHVLAATLTALGILGAVLGLLTGSAAVIAGVAGVGSGAALFTAIALALRYEQHLAARP